MMVKKGAYIGLCLLIGGIGAHHFYAGKWFRGLLYLGFSWSGVPVVLALFDLVIAMFKRPDVNGEIQV